MDWQIQLLQYIQQFKHPVLDAFFQVVTMSAEEYFFIAAAAWILWCHNKTMGFRIGFAFLSSTAFNPFLKNIFRIDRPIGVEGIVSERLHTAPGYAFPSGHTQGATSFWIGVLTYKKRTSFTLLGIAMIFLVALSRLYLGVHWLSDVLGGIFFGCLWVLLSNWVFDYSRRIDRRWLVGLLLLPLLVGYLIFDDKPLTVSFAASCGFLAGYLVEQRFIGFSVRRPWHGQILKIVIGLAGVLVLKEGIKFILPLADKIVDSLRYSLIGFWVSAGAPWLFQRLGLDGQDGKTAGNAL